MRTGAALRVSDGLIRLRTRWLRGGLGVCRVRRVEWSRKRLAVRSTRSDRRAWPGFAALNGAQGFSARFSGSGAVVSARGGHVGLSVAGVGYGTVLRPLEPGAAERVSESCVVLSRHADAVVCERAARD